MIYVGLTQEIALAKRVFLLVLYNYRLRHSMKWVSGSVLAVVGVDTETILLR